MSYMDGVRHIVTRTDRKLYFVVKDSVSPSITRDSIFRIASPIRRVIVDGLGFSVYGRIRQIVKGK
jgi:hypothetical protein